MPSISFKGKSIVHSYHLTLPYRQLLPDETRSLLAEGEVASLTGNVIIQGDNLHALKALIPSFSGKVKCIYIDPPYNTGNEKWVYNDNVSHPMLQEWLNQVVDKEDLTRHDKWLCMMTPRLKLLRELLREDGVIFVSIDDNEAHRLRMLMDEIFGEENFVSTIIWEKADSPKMDVEFFSSRHDYVLVYARNIEMVAINRFHSTEAQKHYDQVDQQGRKYYLKPLRAMGGQGETRKARPNLYYALDAPDGTQIFPKLQDGTDGAWRWSLQKVKQEENRIEWKQSGKGWNPYFRIYADSSMGRPPETIFYHSDVGSSRTSKAQIKEIFVENVAFDTPKPIGLLVKILQIATDEDSIILDSFAGSGTTGQAVLAQNAEDGGNRRFILIEQEEYADSLTAERLRRVIKGVPTAKDKTLQAGLGGSFTYCQLGPNFDEETLFKGGLPDYAGMGRFVFFTSTGEKLDESQIDESRCYLGESSRYSVYLIYKPDIEYLKNVPLDLPFAMKLPPSNGKKRLVIASHKYFDEDRMAEYDVEFCQLPYGIYRYRAE